MNSIIVSIIVPCYKHAHFLNSCLQSVLEQTYEHWECIIVNDGSPDNTDSVAEKWIEKDKRFRYIYQDNAGLSAARNKGISIALGSFILPLDADDLLHENYLEKSVEVLASNNDLGIVSSYSTFFIGDKNTVIYQLKPNGTYWRFLLYVNQLVATSLYRKECWEQVGGYDENMKKGFEDWDFWLSVTKNNWEYKIIPEFLFFYRKAKKSMLVDTINNHFEENRKYIAIKHKELYIDDFENCMEVLFFEINQHRKSNNMIKNSIEYKIGLLITKPFKLIKKIFMKL